MSDPRVKYEQMIADLRNQLRPQREWGEGRGVLMVVGHFVVGIAAGGWLISSLFNSLTGLLLSYSLGLIGGLTHLGFLGHPARFWRMATRVKTSWIARGFLGLTLFLLGGLLHLPAALEIQGMWVAGSIPAKFGSALALVGMVILIGYMGFVYTTSKAIPFWNSPLHPALYVAYAVRGGVATVLVARAIEASQEQANQLMFLWIGVTAVVGLLLALELYGAYTNESNAARRSVRDFVAGRLAPYFYGGILVIGFVVPSYLVWNGGSEPPSPGVMAMVGAASAVGDFFMKYATIRAGVHRPVWTRMRPGGVQS